MIANVMRQSGCDVPEWMLACVHMPFNPRPTFYVLIVPSPVSSCALRLKNPSKKERKQVKRRPVERTDVRTVGGSGLGRQQAQKKREMVEGSKRRKTKPEGEGHVVGGGKQKGGSGEVDLAE
jgi:ATP-dependent RNA helicase DDX52/ROK1